MREGTQRIRLKDWAAEQLIDLVVSEGLRPGNRLPPERDLVARLEVSRTVVREALNLLEARGLLSIEHGRGAVVSDDGSQAIRDTLGLLLRIRPRTLWELLEMRHILEVEISGLAAERAGSSDIEEMRAQLERMRTAIDELEGYMDADVEFHALLAGSAGNDLLLTMLDPVVKLLRASREMSISQPGSARRALREHEKILRCVEVGEAERARWEMRAHLAATAEDIRSAIGEQALDPRLPEFREGSALRRSSRGLEKISAD